MSATPASRPIASLTALNERSRSKMSVTSEMRSMNTNDRSLRKASCSACSTDRKNTDAEVTLGVTAAAAQLVPLRGQPALELGHDAMDRRQVLQRPGGECTVELAQRPGRRKLAVALDHR